MILDFFSESRQKGLSQCINEVLRQLNFCSLCSPKIIALRIISLLFTIVHCVDTSNINYYAQQKIIGLKQLWFILTLVKIYNFNIKTVTVFLNVEKNVISKSFFYHLNVCIFDKSAVISHNNLNFENLRCHNRDPVDAILHQILLNNNRWFHGDSKFYLMKDTVVWSS